MEHRVGDRRRVGSVGSGAVCYEELAVLRTLTPGADLSRVGAVFFVCGVDVTDCNHEDP